MQECYSSYLTLKVKLPIFSCKSMKMCKEKKRSIPLNTLCMFFDTPPLRAANISCSFSSFHLRLREADFNLRTDQNQ